MCTSPRFINGVQVPCNTCAECLLSRKFYIATQSNFVSFIHDIQIFFTLTYDDKHLPISEYTDLDGVIYNLPTLYPTHVTNFFKRLRKRGFDFKYFYCGEYGEKTYRPHYHVYMSLNRIHLESMIRAIQENWFYGFVYPSPKSRTADWISHGDCSNYISKYISTLSVYPHIYLKAANIIPNNCNIIYNRKFYKSLNLQVSFVRHSCGLQKHFGNKFGYFALFRSFIKDNIRYLVNLKLHLENEKIYQHCNYYCQIHLSNSCRAGLNSELYERLKKVLSRVVLHFKGHQFSLPTRVIFSFCPPYWRKILLTFYMLFNPNDEDLDLRKIRSEEKIKAIRKSIINYI